MSVDIIYIDDTQSNTNTHITQSTAESLIASEIGSAQLSQSYTLDFDDTDLTAGKITFTHNLGQKYVVLNLFDNSDNEVLPDEATAKTINTTEIDLTSYGTITGTWNVIIGTGGGGANTDSDAVHKSTAGEFTGITEKTTLVDDDLFIIEDSADSGNKKKVRSSNISGGGGASAFTDLTDTPSAYTGQAGKVATVNTGETALEFTDAGGGGDVTASANITDNSIARGDGGSKGIQESGIIIDDSDNVTGVADLTATGNIDADTFSGDGSSLTDVTGTDSNAIHDNVASEITAITEKTTPVSDDVILIEDSADSNNKKKLKMSNVWDTIPSPGTGFATIAYDDFTDNEAVAFELPSKSVVTDVHVEITSVFNTGYSGQCGYEANKEAFLSAFVADVTGLKNEPYDAENEMLSTSTTTDINVYMASPSGSWSVGATLDTATKFAGSCGSYNAGLVAGGFDSVNLNNTQEFNGTSFSASGNLPTATTQGAMFGTQSDAVFSGGNSEVSTVFNYNGATWSTNSNSLNGGRRLHGGSGSSSNGIVGGGFNGGALSTCEIWNGTTFSTTGNSLNTARYYLEMNGDGNSAISIGGTTGTTTAVCELWNGVSWTPTGSMNKASQSKQTMGGVNDAKFIDGLGTDLSVEDFNGATWDIGEDILVTRNSGSGFGTSGLGLLAGGTSTADPSNTSTKWASATLTMGEMKVYYSLTDYGA